MIFNHQHRYVRFLNHDLAGGDEDAEVDDSCLRPVYQAEYSGNLRSGPDHKSTFSTTLIVKSESSTLLTERGVAKSLKAAQQEAALAALKDLIPMTGGAVLPPAANRFWKKHFEHLLAGQPGRIVGVCGVEQFRVLNSVGAYLDLKAFSNSLPELSPYLEDRKFVDVLTRSVGRLSAPSSAEALKVGKKGIALITSKPPDDIEGFTSADIEAWLANFRKASGSLKLPTKQISLPLRTVPLTDLRDIREWNISISGNDKCVVSEPMFAHILTLLELLEEEDLGPRKDIDATAGARHDDWLSVQLRLHKDWSRLQLEQLVERLSLNAFFSGVQDTVRGDSNAVAVEVKGLIFEADGNPYTHAYVDILKRFYHTQDHLRSLYRIVHDLKNEVIAVRNYAMRAKKDATSKYRMFVAIESLQNDIREKETALGVYFSAVDESKLAAVNLQQVVRDFLTKQIPLLPERIRPHFTENLESAHVMANKELLISLLDNLTQNAIDAMPNGGRLSLSVSYKASDSMLDIDISDTGVGIPVDVLPDLFTSLKSTKKKGMGLGLATVKTIVEQHDGLIDVQTALGKGTRFTILLPLKKASDPLYASTNS